MKCANHIIPQIRFDGIEDEQNAPKEKRKNGNARKYGSAARRTFPSASNHPNHPNQENCEE